MQIELVLLWGAVKQPEKRRIAFRRCCSWLVVASVLTCVAPFVSSAVTGLSFLRTEGQDILNEQGDKVLLRGVGLGNWMLPEGYMWKFGNQGDRPRRIEKIVSDLIGPEDAGRFWTEFRNNYITEADIRRIAELGYNSVRPALNSRLFLTEGDNPVRVEEGFRLLDNLVAWCRAHGVYVIIDMHGAPGGQTGQNIDDSANDEPLLFMETKYQDQLVNLWRTIADRYKDEPTVAGYDLLNEPLPQRTGAAGKYRHLVEPLYKRITQAIREVDPKHMIILEGVDWANDWSIFTKRFDENLVYQFHYYCWDTPAKLKGIQQYLEHRERLNAPVWVGETGERDNTIYWATTEYFEANNIGWSFWPWKKLDANNAPFSIKRPQQWDAVADYSNGGAKPDKEVARKAFDELLANIRLENCVYFPAVVNSMLRRAPARIEAENFGQSGANKSYHVTDASRLSPQYRLSEPVPIESQTMGRRRSDQYITLTDSEWTAYTIFCDVPKDFTVKVRVKAVKGAAEARLTVGDRDLEVKVGKSEWTDVKLGAVALSRGSNSLKLLVKNGSVEVDWIELAVAQADQQSSSLKSQSEQN